MVGVGLSLGNRLSEFLVLRSSIVLMSSAARPLAGRTVRSCAHHTSEVQVLVELGRQPRSPE